MKRARTWFLLIVLMSPLAAESQSWNPPFDHQDPFNVWASFPPPPGNPMYNNNAFFNAVHLAVIPKGPNQGKVLVWDWENYSQTPAVYQQRWSIVDWRLANNNPAKYQNFILNISALGGLGDPMCSGHAWTDAGDLFVAGGNWYTGNPVMLKANQLAFLFLPNANPPGQSSWQPQTNLTVDRWYPSVTQLGNGKMLVSGGASASVPGLGYLTYEVFDPATNTWDTNQVTGSPLFNLKAFLGPQPPADAFTEYPRIQLLPFGGGPTSTGAVFVSGYGSKSSRMDYSLNPTASPEQWLAQTTWPNPTIGQRHDGSSLLYPNNLNPVLENTVVRLGGLYGSPAMTTQTVEFIDAGAATPTWIPGPPLATQRYQQNAVILADGTILVVGGKQNATGPIVPAQKPELFVPGVGWVNMPAESSPRPYHSTAVLLPSGQLLSAGGEYGIIWTPAPNGRNADYQIFNPPYLTSGLPRPRITQAPQTIQHMQPSNPTGLKYKVYFTYSGPGNVSKVVLISPGSVTHHSDFHQRWVQLFNGVVGSDDAGKFIELYPPLPMGVSLSVGGIPVASHAPKGYYMLFLLTDQTGPLFLGVPSEAAWVKLQ